AEPDQVPPRSDDCGDAGRTAALARGGPARFAAVVRALRHLIWLVCALAAATGLAVIAFGGIAVRGDPGATAVLVLVGGPLVVLAVLIARHTGALAKAIARPADTIDQARDLALRAKGSPELHRLARTIVARKATGRRGRGGGSGSGIGRVRRAVRSGRMISAVIGLAQPDPKRHDLLVPFTPMRLRRLWLEVTVALWWWLVAAIVAFVAFFAALLSFL
ncbi:MAG: hypothetical protein U0P45_17130, partial [Acidimicrobiales bacterium]